jgi:hypothetical protein
MCSGFPEVEDPDKYIKMFFEHEFEVDPAILN